jgi:peptidoglycan/LPS O-acetylase OafA/YrhL
VFRWAAINHQKELYFHTLSTLANFAIGAIVASISFNKTQAFYFLKSITKAQIGSIYFLFFLNVIFYKDLYASPTMQIFERLIFSLFFGFIIFEQAFSEVPFINMGKWKISNYFGHASFGLYCYHGIVITLFIKLSEHFAWDFSLFQVTFLNPALLLLATMGVTYLSYEILEKRILKYKKQFYSLKAN